MDDFKKLTEQLMKIYSNAESVNDLGIENYFDENISRGIIQKIYKLY